jgi:DNA-binding beta-propeller fold protein YncE
MILYNLKKINANFKTTFFFFYVFYLFLSVGGCATSEFQPSGSQEDTTIVWPPPPQKPRIQYLHNISTISRSVIEKSWISKATEFLFGKEEIKGIMLRPYGVFADADRVYVTDPGFSLVHIFWLKEKKYFQIFKTKNEDLISPIGIAVDKNGNIFISDSMLRKVLEFNRDGTFTREVGSPKMFARPSGIAVDEERIYLVDTHAHKVILFSKSDGKVLSEFGRNGSGEGEFNYPTNIFIGKDGLLYISDSLNFRVQIFDKNGRFISSFGKHGDGLGDFSKPKGIAVDSEGHIYVADAHFDNIQIFDRYGKLLLFFGNTGRKNGEMVLPAGIFIDDLDRIYVADSYNNRIQVFQYLKESK